MDVVKIKTHLKENKTTYISVVVTAVTVAGITMLIMRSIELQRISRGISVTANRGISVVADRSVVTNNVSLISSRRQGAPSWVVRCIETNEIFTSQREAARAMGLSEAELSQHLNGMMKHVRGWTFERIAMAV